MAIKNCIVCNEEISGRADKITCSSQCRLKHHRKDVPENRTHSPSIRLEKNRVYEYAIELAGTYYTTPPQHRAEFCENLVRRVLAGENNLRKALTAPSLLKPTRKAGDVQTSLFFRRDHLSYRTMEEIINSYCYESRWGMSSSRLFKGQGEDHCAKEGTEMYSAIRDTDRLDKPFAYKEAKRTTRRAPKHPELTRPPLPKWLEVYVAGSPNPNLMGEAA